VSGDLGRNLAIGWVAVIAIIATGCTATTPNSPLSSDSPLPSSAAPSASAATTYKPGPTTSAQPVPKVNRSDSTAAPTATAKPANTDGTVKYGDGVTLRIRSVHFAKETDKGPGAFPGRQYAVLELSITNGSKKPMTLDTVVVTVLDKKGNPVSPVYAEKAKVQDFAGTLKLGATAAARYAFAVPTSSRSKVTVVVDFDGVHTSAVFRGGLSA